MSYLLLWFALAVVVVDWVAVARGWRRVEYVLKPGYMLLLLAWMGVSSSFAGHLVWFGLGLLLCMAGDIFLMLPRDLFIPGLVAFLLGHLAYLVGFNATLPPVNLPALALALLVALVSSQVYRRIAAGLQTGGRAKLKGPVMAYSIVISLMLISALYTFLRPDWSATTAMLVSGGAFLFYLSDVLLAWNRFVAPLPTRRVGSMIPYHLGQMLITLGTTLHFLGLL